MDIPKKIKIYQILLIAFFLIPLNFYSDNDIFFGVGIGSDGISAARLSKNYDLGSFFETSLNNSSELGLNFWDGDTNNSDSESSNTSLTLSHIISYEFESNFFLNTGVGLALLTDNKIGDRNLGSSLQFESRFGFGYRTNNTNSSVNIFHYSNAGTANDNSGVNILMLNLSHLF